ncbi:hypothetical protein ES707_07231 [subsurface metagenome]
MLNQYLQNILKTFKSGDTTEPSFYPNLKNLIEEFSKSKGITTNITIQPKRIEAGAPDFTIRRGKELVGYIEAKDIGKDLELFEYTPQIERYKKDFDNFILTNYFDLWLWRKSEKKWILKTRISVGELIALKLNQLPPLKNEENFFNLIETFLDFNIPERKTAKALATELASRAKLIPACIIEELNNDVETEIDRIYEAFKKYLITDLCKKDFADIYAQTITYGLFMARLRHKEKGFNRFLAQKYIPKNIQILKDTFSLISGSNLPESISWAVDDIATILAYADIEKIKKELHQRTGGDDPLIHFYETFLKEYNPKEKKHRGVFYTPLPVVSYITCSINILLKEKFGKKSGFADKNVNILDPASGTLTFPAKSILIAKEEIDKSPNAGSWLQVVKNHILKDYYAFELLMAPYIIGHLKISLLLEDLGYRLENSDRFPLYLTNTLDLSEIEQAMLPYVAGLSEEARKAMKVKKDVPILVVMGNPPYSVSSSNIIKKGSDFNDLYESYKEKVRKEERNIQPLSDDYIKFIAFAHWKIKQAGQGIVGMITNNSYLDGLIHRDMRQKLSEDFDEIYLLNLHGNYKRKEKTPEGGKDENVFDIQQGVGIILLVKTGERKTPAIKYADLYGLREEKYKFLEDHDIKNTKWHEVEIKEPNYFFILKDTKGEKIYSQFTSLKDIFNKYNAGIATGKDDVLVDFKKDNLIRKLSIMDKDLFKNLMSNYKVSEGLIEKWYQELKDKDIEKQVKIYNYRPFDNRFIIYNAKILQRARKNIMDNFLSDNVAIVTIKNSKQVNFDEVFITNYLTDKHLIGHQTFVFPLFIYLGSSGNNLFDKGPIQQSNFNPKFWQKITLSFIETISPWSIFYYIYAILYSNTYRKKYNEFLKVDFPRIPFTKDAKLFFTITEIGEELANLHLLKSEKLEKIGVTFPVVGDNRIRMREYNEKGGRLYINEKQYFGAIKKEVWNYYIGGYQVLDKWLKDRIDKVLSNEDVNHFLKVINALNWTIYFQKEIDKIYPNIERNLIK